MTIRQPSVCNINCREVGQLPALHLCSLLCLKTFLTVDTCERLLKVGKVGAVGYSLVVKRAPDGTENGILRGTSDSTSFS